MLKYSEVPKCPKILKGVIVKAKDFVTLGEHLPSWAGLNRTLIEQPDREDMTKKALLMELAGKRRPYECGRLLAFSLQANSERIRNEAMQELKDCLS